jgi:hypothetical protein
MTEKRLTNSELHLIRLDEEESQRKEDPGILELFRDGKPEPDENAPLERDPGK